MQVHGTCSACSQLVWCRGDAGRLGVACPVWTYGSCSCQACMMSGCGRPTSGSCVCPNRMLQMCSELRAAGAHWLPTGCCAWAGAAGQDQEAEQWVPSAMYDFPSAYCIQQLTFPVFSVREGTCVVLLACGCFLTLSSRRGIKIMSSCCQCVLSALQGVI